MKDVEKNDPLASPRVQRIGGCDCDLWHLLDCRRHTHDPDARTPRQTSSTAECRVRLYVPWLPHNYTAIRVIWSLLMFLFNCIRNSRTDRGRCYFNGLPHCLQYVAIIIKQEKCFQSFGITIKRKMWCLRFFCTIVDVHHHQCSSSSSSKRKTDMCCYFRRT